MSKKPNWWHISNEEEPGNPLSRLNWFQQNTPLTTIEELFGIIDRMEAEKRQAFEDGLGFGLRAICPSCGAAGEDATQSAEKEK
jgi:hypothetical protein